MPMAAHALDNTRFPLVQDIVFTSKWLQFILKCAKNVQKMHFASQFKSVYIPKLACVETCPIQTNETMIPNLKLIDSDP